MAARGESQGLQIAVILLTMCVVGLAVSTWVCYQSAETNFKAKESAEASTKSANDQKNVEIYKLKIYQHVVGDQTVSEEDIGRAKSSAGNASDPTAETLLENYKKLIAGHDKAFADGKSKSLLALPGYLIDGIVARNEQLKDTQKREDDLKVAVKDTEDREQKRTQTAETTMQTATKDLAEERKKFDEERAKHKKDLADMNATIVTLQGELKTQKDKTQKDLALLNTRKAELEKEIADLSDKVISLQKDGPSFEVADGQITWINQRQRICWIDVGRDDGLTRQTTFSVYDHDENGVSSAKSKAKIEVIRVVESHLAECRIVTDDIKNPILPGDKIFTPAWSPGQRLHFALVGFLDINGDNQPDNDEIKAIIELNGGMVDAQVRPDGTVVGEITNQTRYLIRGKPPSEKSFTADDGKRAFQNYSDIQEKAKDFGVEIIEVSKFFALMGWKSQERTTKIGPKRTLVKPEAAEGKTKAPASDETEKEDMPADKGAKPMVEDDPFK